MYGIGGIYKLNLEEGVGIKGVENINFVGICRNWGKLDFFKEVYFIYKYDWEDKVSWY